MALRFFDLTKTDCRWLCWCVPARGSRSELARFKSQYPPLPGSDAVAQVTEDTPRHKGVSLYARAYLDRPRGKSPRAAYLLRVSLEVREPRNRGAGGPTPRQAARPREFLRFLETTLPRSAAPTAVSLCAEFRYDTRERRPVVELPVELVIKGEQDDRFAGSRLEGVEVSFPQPGMPIRHVRIRVTDSPARVWIRVAATAKLELGHDPLGVVYRKAASLADLFTEEVQAR